jgi:hypothetical protein
MKVTAFWDMEPCSLIEEDRRLEVHASSIISHCPGDGGSSMHLCNVSYFHESTPCHISEDCNLLRLRVTENRVLGKIFRPKTEK